MENFWNGFNWFWNYSWFYLGWKLRYVGSSHNTFNNWYKNLFLVVAFSTLDNAKLLEQLKSGFKRIINWNKYQTKASTEKPSKYSDFLLDPRVNE